MLAKPADDIVTRPSVPELPCPVSGELPQEHGVAGIRSLCGGSSERHTEAGTWGKSARTAESVFMGFSGQTDEGKQVTTT